MESCDFTGARLDSCRLLGDAIRDVRFSSWPTIVLPQPSEHEEELLRVGLPGKLGMVFHKRHDPDVRFCIDDAERLVQKYGGSLDALRDVLQRFPNAVRL